MEKTWRRWFLVVCVVVLLGGTGWSAMVAADETRPQNTRSLALLGVGLCSLLAGTAAARLLKPWLKARETPAAARLTR